MKARYLKLKNWLLLTVMGGLGFTACHSHKKVAKDNVIVDSVVLEDRGEARLMYGVPTMEFRIQGQVKDAEGKPVRNIKINMLERGMEASADGVLQGDPESVERWLESTAVSTDESGHFELTNSGIPQEQVRLLVRDVDGKENGEFRNQLLEVDVDRSDIDGSNAGGWNQGTLKKNLDIKLEKK